jgi:TNF receptor-associated factor 4
MACETIIAHGKELDNNMKQLAMHTNKIEVLERKVDTLEKLYGCQLVWRIERWEEKMSEGKLGRKPTIFSPPFLTSRHGYRMAMSLCPYGDGRGNNGNTFCICDFSPFYKLHA